MLKFWIILTTFLISVISMPIIIYFCKKHNLYDSTNERKIHKGNIPRLGGVGIFVAFFIGTIVYALMFSQLGLGRVLPLIIGALIIFVFGLLDDILDIPAIVKLLVQITAACIVVFAGYHFGSIMAWKLPKWISIILTLGWIIGIINAYNLIDGLDALCGGLTFVSFVTIGICLSLLKDSGAVLCLIMAAAIFGFLCFNRPPASIFMGDCGSQFLGFMLAVLPLYETGRKFEYVEFIFMLVIVSIPMMDTIAAIWRRTREHQPIMHADRFHVHHKLLNLGCNKVGALAVLLGFQVLLCTGAACSVIFFSEFVSAVLLVGEFIFVSIVYAILHYWHRHVMRKKALVSEASAKDSVKSE